MAEEARDTTSGWGFRLRRLIAGGGYHGPEQWLVAIPEDHAAEEALKRTLGVEFEIMDRQQVSENAISGAKLKPGDVEPWMG
jgi:hypothetical protein